MITVAPSSLFRNQFSRLNPKMAKFAVFLLAVLAAASALPSQIKSSRFFGTLIVGGEDAEQGELPYQIDVRVVDYQTCGGSLVVVNGQQLVITAAQCVQGVAPAYITVTAGDLSHRIHSGLEQVRQVNRIVVHEDYGNFGNENDIALLFFAYGFDLNGNVSTIALPTQNQQTTGDVLVSGWGYTSSSGGIPDILQKVQIPVVSDAECESAYSSEYFVESMLCAGLPQGGKDSCQGDSGGPLVAINGGYLAGIVSWGYSCAAAGYPRVNTEVSYFVDWIEANL